MDTKAKMTFVQQYRMVTWKEVEVCDCELGQLVKIIKLSEINMQVGWFTSLTYLINKKAGVLFML